jgi:hypothetical protein
MGGGVANATEKATTCLARRVAVDLRNEEPVVHRRRS